MSRVTEEVAKSLEYNKGKMLALRGRLFLIHDFTIETVTKKVFFKTKTIYFVSNLKVICYNRKINKLTPLDEYSIQLHLLNRLDDLHSEYCLYKKEFEKFGIGFMRTQPIESLIK